MLRDDGFDLQCMRRALALAQRGEGQVEPNPMVGCVVARAGAVIGEGWHQRFGGPHAEVEALRPLAQPLDDATLYVTLEPCCHQGKTPPCTEEIVRRRVGRVVVAHPDPFPQVAGQGLEQLRAAGLEVDVGLCQDEAAELLAPYLMRLTEGRPWVVGKYAMSWDGKIATTGGDSRWISNEQSRAVVHRLRGRMDAILVGIGTAERDDPLLTARPPGPRTPLRVVLDSTARLAATSQLVRTARETPLLVAAADDAPAERVGELRAAGCEVWQHAGDRPQRLRELLAELARRGMTNLLVEGGGEVLGALADAQCLDELHVFLAPKLIGGQNATSPLRGQGCRAMAEACQLVQFSVELLNGDVYLRGRVRRNTQRRAEGDSH